MDELRKNGSGEPNLKELKILEPDEVLREKIKELEAKIIMGTYELRYWRYLVDLDNKDTQLMGSLDTTRKNLQGFITLYNQVTKLFEELGGEYEKERFEGSLMGGM